MTATLPEVPACWGWEPFPLPQPSSIYILKAWHAERCAICGTICPDVPSGPYVRGLRTVGLDEDHDHATGNTRGYLCPECNMAEGRSDAPAFQRYRERPPAAILGVLARYHARVHPEIRKARDDWESALSDLHHHTEHRRRHPTQPSAPMTPLMEAAARVGLDWDEWIGDAPHFPHRWRYRLGLDPSDRWAEMYADELIQWARERRENARTVAA